MIDYNAAVLELLKNRTVCGESEVRKFQILHQAATKTRDLRFVDTLGWFASELERRVRGTTETEFSSQIVARIFASNAAGLEVFVELPVENGASIKVPYLLSPHWRY